MNHDKTGSNILDIIRINANLNNYTPMEVYKNFKFAFKALEEAPFKFKNVKSIIVADKTIDLANHNLEDVLDELANTNYKTFKIIMNDNSYYELFSKSTAQKGIIPKTVINILTLFAS